MKVQLEKGGGMNFTAHAGAHTMQISASAKLGGASEGAHAGMRPMETVLAGLGGCSGIDVAMILQKSRQQLRGMRIEIEAERAPSEPAVFTRIHMRYILQGQLDPKKVARALSLSVEKYCSVARMLAHTAAITYDFTIAE